MPPSSPNTIPNSPSGESLGGTLSFEIITDAERLRLLGPEWDELYGKNDQSVFTQSFAWCSTALQIMEDRRSQPLYCLIGRKQGCLVLIWPFVVLRRGRLRIAQQLGTGFWEGHALLIAAECDSAATLAEAWKYLKRAVTADLIELRRVPEASSVRSMIEQAEAIYTVEGERAVVVDWREYPNWEDYLAGRSRDQLRSLRRKHRRLTEQGKLSFEMVTDDQEFDDTLAWTWKHKLEWMKAVGKENPWIGRHDFFEFYKTMHALPEGKTRIVFFVMRHNDETIASELCLINARRLLWMIAAFDERVGKYSPGQLMQEHCLRWAFDHRLSTEIGFGDEAYKVLLANQEKYEMTYIVPLSWLGCAAVLKAKAANFIKTVSRWRPWANALHERHETSQPSTAAK